MSPRRDCASLRLLQHMHLDTNHHRSNTCLLSRKFTIHNIYNNTTIQQYNNAAFLVLASLLWCSDARPGYGFVAALTFPLKTSCLSLEFSLGLERAVGMSFDLARRYIEIHTAA
jgi:hypothetical protein